MTREEAIRIFRKEIECLSHTKCEDCILEKACDPMNTTPYDSEYIEAYSMAIKALEQEPRKGHWIEQIDHEENCRTLICSNCDRPALHDGDSIWKHKFCPHCGADMRGGEV